MPRPVPTPVYHFTHIEHLPEIIRRGLLADTLARVTDSVIYDAGNRDIKARRRERHVPIQPGGVIADYVPFYFAPRSPMMYAIERGNVPEYSDGTDSLAYLISDVERLIQLGLHVLTTDRNAVLDYAAFYTGTEGLNNAIDWDLMCQKMWNNTPDEPDRMERRMAECLVYQAVPWSAFTALHVRTSSRKGQVLTLVGEEYGPQVEVSPWMYF